MSGAGLTRRQSTLLFALLAACSEPGAPPPDPVSLLQQAGANQFGLPGSTLSERLQIIVLDPVNKRPRQNVAITWRVVSGSGASITADKSTTGTDGIIRATARLGSSLGEYVFEATSANLTSSPARFSARAVQQPAISGITPPGGADAGDTITISGTNFSAAAAENAVLFSGARGRVLSASETSLRVIVPVCVPTRNASVTVALGQVASAAQTLSVTGTPGAALQLQRGQVRVFRDSAELACQRMPALAGSQFLIIPQNVSEVVGSQTPFELLGLTPSAVALARPLAFGAPQRSDFASGWEMQLRARERAFPSVAAGEVPVAMRLRMRAPEIGDRSEFKVFDRNNRFVTVTAEVKAISQRAIIYQDLEAPANGFTVAQFQQLGSSFDSPTSEVNVSVYGEPSDIDANAKVIILLTPVVNELTPRGSNGFVAGFFFGCDLQTVGVCSGTNSGEIFYMFVPDPTGRHSDARSTQVVMNASLPVLAHEFQHMISFGARKTLDALWLSEGLAHHAEDLVADEYRRRGDSNNAALFSAQNYTRAAIYLRDSTRVSLLSEELPGSLEIRGGAWLMVKYLAGQYGGNTLLRTLARSTTSSVQNVTAATGQTWSTLLADWGVALWADDAPELAGVQLNARHTFNNINLRTALNAPYPLRPLQLGFSNLLFNGIMPASSQRHVLLDGGAGTNSLNLVFSGQLGGPFDSRATPQLTFLRVR